MVEGTEEVVRELKRELDIKRVPPPVKRAERKSGRANGTADDSELVSRPRAISLSIGFRADQTVFPKDRY